MAHAVEIDKQSVNLKDEMGVLVELDNLYWEGEKYFETNNGDKLVLKDARSDDMADVAMEDFLKDYNMFEKAVIERDYEKLSELVDVKSFAQYYLLSEFTVNPDAYWTSFYMYKNGANDKIHAGPGWDFDLSLGNKNWSNWLGDEFYATDATMIRKKELLTKDEYESSGLGEWFSSGAALSRIVFNLMDLPEFQDLVKEVYTQRMRGREDELLWIIGRMVERIEVAAEVDGEKWESGVFLQEVKTMKKWIIERYRYFDEVYGDEKVLMGR